MDVASKRMAGGHSQPPNGQQKCGETQKHDARAQEVAWRRRVSDATGGQKEHKDDDHQRRPASQKVIAGAEAISSPSEKEQDEQDDEDVHDIEWGTWVCLAWGGL